MLQAEIRTLQHKLLEMGGLAEQMLRQAIESVLTRDEALAQSVVDADDMVDQFENEIESSCIQLIALHQPVAFELRFLTMVMKISHNIERLADKSVAIAKRGIELLEYPPIKPFVDLPHAAQVIQTMVKDVLDAFVNRNAELALEIRERDNEVDEIYERMLHELLTILSEHPKLIQPGISFLLLFRHLERVGDLAANISEEVYYLVKGDVIRHSDTH
ncbi:phosphate transport system regulatory protein PhoU [Candidatus Poribacteria bacterium]|nr:MAG: phosphate transport system regulatory protein PhoU [Candidatus Poribacteria bacterium]